jgi:integrase
VPTNADEAGAEHDPTNPETFPQASLPQGTEERPLPDYDGRPEERPSFSDGALWVPRVAFFPLYLVSEFVVRRPLGVLVTAAEQGHWLDVLSDFFTFDEAKRLVAAADGEWRTMILVALRTGMRIGELLALQWQDGDLVAGRITVRRNVVWGHLGTPKSGKSREIPLSNDAQKALKDHRHLRGALVFCDAGGHMLTEGEVRHPMWRACKRAGLRLITWHVCRHSFASHLVMRGAPIKAVQELLGHSSILMTMRYAHLAPEVARDAVQLLDLDGQSLGRAAAKTA